MWFSCGPIDLPLAATEGCTACIQFSPLLANMLLFDAKLYNHLLMQNLEIRILEQNSHKPLYDQVRVCRRRQYRLASSGNPVMNDTYRPVRFFTNEFYEERQSCAA